MNLLLFNFFICAGLGLVLSLSSIKTKDINDAYLLLSFMILLYFHSMVDPSSMFDLPFYNQIYQDFSWMSWSQCLNVQDFHMEVGYRLFMKTVSLLSTNFTVFLFVYSTIFLSLYYFVIRKYSPWAILSVIIFLLSIYNQSLFVIRQHLAVALCFASLPLIISRQLSRFLIVSAIAFFLHQSSIVFVPVFFFYQLKGKKLIWTIIITTLVLFFSSTTLITLFANEFGYRTYIEMEKYSGLNYVSFFISLSFLLLYIFTMKTKIFESGIKKVVFIGLVLSTMINLFGVGFSVGRLGLYFSVFPILSLPLSVVQIKETWLRYVIVVVALFFLFYIAYWGSSYEYIKNYRIV